MLTATDYVYLNQALRLARKGLYTTAPNPRVGCVIARDNQLIATGWHQRAGSAHAEVNALEVAGGLARGADCYVSLEPCAHSGRTPACTSALIEAGVKRVLFAGSDPNPQARGGGQILRDAGISVSGDLLPQLAQDLNPGFYQRMRTGRPYLRYKIALSVDGRSSGLRRWLSGAAARHDVHKWRARSDAIISTSSTVMADDPQLNVRGFEQDYLPPAKVILDSNLRVAPQARLWRTEGICYWCFARELQAQAQRLVKKLPTGVELLPLRRAAAGLDLAQLLTELGHRQINEIWCEAGATLGADLLQQQLIDELIVYQAAHIAGAPAAPMFNTQTIIRQRLSLQQQRAIGEDVRSIYRLREALSKSLCRVKCKE